jgi:hypothetical protein
MLMEIQGPSTKLVTEARKAWKGMPLQLQLHGQTIHFFVIVWKLSWIIIWTFSKSVECCSVRHPKAGFIQHPKNTAAPEYTTF